MVPVFSVSACAECPADSISAPALLRPLRFASCRVLPTSPDNAAGLPGGVPVWKA